MGEDFDGDVNSIMDGAMEEQACDVPENLKKRSLNNSKGKLQGGSVAPFFCVAECGQ